MFATALGHRGDTLGIQSRVRGLVVSGSNMFQYLSTKSIHTELYESLKFPFSLGFSAKQTSVRIQPLFLEL